MMQNEGGRSSEVAYGLETSTNTTTISGDGKGAESSTVTGATVSFVHAWCVREAEGNMGTNE
jgi:hypothetical protein